MTDSIVPAQPFGMTKFEHRFSETEIKQTFNEQMAALKSSCDAFDRGERWEAKRLATPIYVLCHDHPFKKTKTKSLLGQLNLKSQLGFLSTAKPLIPGDFVHTPLVILSGGETPYRYEPELDGRKQFWKWVKFRNWWDEEIFITHTGRTLSRKNLVWTMRTQDGAAHADEVISDEEYHTLKALVHPGLQRSKPVPGTPNALSFVQIKDSSSRMIVSGGGGRIPLLDLENPLTWEPVPDAHLSSVRQIAFELLQTLNPIIVAS